MDRHALAIGPTAARHRQRHCVIPDVIVSVGRVLCAVVRCTIAKVPIPGRDAAAGLVGELHRQGRLTRSRIGAEISRGRPGRGRGDMDRHALAIGPAAARHRQHHRVIPDVIVSVSRVLCAVVRCTIAKVPIPSRDAAAGTVGELHRQGRVARTRVGAEIRRGRQGRTRAAKGLLQIEPATAHALARQCRQRVNVRHNPVDNLLVVIVREMCRQQRATSGDMRRRHGSAVKISVIAVGPVPARENRRARRAEVHCRGSIIGKVCEFIRARGGRDGNDVVQVVAGRINRVHTIVLRRVACGRHENDAGLAQTVDGVAQRGGIKGRAAPTGVDNPGALGARVIHALDRVRKKTVSR